MKKFRLKSIISLIVLTINVIFLFTAYAQNDESDDMESFVQAFYDLEKLKYIEEGYHAEKSKENTLEGRINCLKLVRHKAINKAKNQIKKRLLNSLDNNILNHFNKLGHKKEMINNNIQIIFKEPEILDQDCNKTTGICHCYMRVESKGAVLSKALTKTLRDIKTTSKNNSKSAKEMEKVKKSLSIVEKYFNEKKYGKAESICHELLITKYPTIKQEANEWLGKIAYKYFWIGHWFYTKQSDCENAKKYVLKAIQLRPENEKFNKFLAKVKSSKGRLNIYCNSQTNITIDDRVKKISTLSDGFELKCGHHQLVLRQGIKIIKKDIIIKPDHATKIIWVGNDVVSTFQFSLKNKSERDDEIKLDEIFNLSMKGEYCQAQKILTTIIKSNEKFASAKFTKQLRQECSKKCNLERIAKKRAESEISLQKPKLTVGIFPLIFSGIKDDKIYNNILKKFSEKAIFLKAKENTSTIEFKLIEQKKTASYKKDMSIKEYSDFIISYEIEVRSSNDIIDAIKNFKMPEVTAGELPSNIAEDLKKLMQKLDLDFISFLKIHVERPDGEVKLNLALNVYRTDNPVKPFIKNWNDKMIDDLTMLVPNIVEEINKAVNSDSFNNS